MAYYEIHKDTYVKQIRWCYNNKIIVKVLKEDKSFSPHHRCQRWSQPHKQYTSPSPITPYNNALVNIKPTALLEYNATPLFVSTYAWIIMNSNKNNYPFTHIPV